MLTELQKGTYLKHEGSKCPYCESHELEGYDGYDADGDYITAKIQCNTCEKTWRDLYRLSEIIED